MVPRIDIAFPGFRAAQVGFIREPTSGLDVLVTDTGDALVDDLGNFLTV